MFFCFILLLIFLLKVFNAQAKMCQIESIKTAAYGQEVRFCHAQRLFRVQMSSESFSNMRIIAL